jgi:hypothetical protein
MYVIGMHNHGAEHIPVGPVNNATSEISNSKSKHCNTAKRKHALALYAHIEYVHVTAFLRLDFVRLVKIIPDNNLFISVKSEPILNNEIHCYMITDFIHFYLINNANKNNFVASLLYILIRMIVYIVHQTLKQFLLYCSYLTK